MTTLRELVTKLRFSFGAGDRRTLAQYEAGQHRVRGNAGTMAKANRQLAQSNANLGASFVGLNRAMMGLGAGLGFAFGAKAIVDAGNSLDTLENRIRAIEGADAPIRAVRRELAGLASENFSNLEDTTQIFQRFRIGTEDLGKTRNEILRFTDLVQKAGATSGSNPVEANAALIQFAQGISSNRFSGEEFRSVSEQLPTILRVLKRDLGLTMGQLREKAFAGELDADTIFGAFDRQEDFIRESFSQLKVTRALALQQFKVGMTTFFGAFTQGSQYNDDLATLFQGLGKWLTDNERAARRWGIAFGDAFRGVGDVFAELFGGSGAFSSVGKTFSRLGASLDNARAFLRIYTELRSVGVSRGEAFNSAAEMMFGPEAAENMRKVAQQLKPIGQAIGAIFASRAIVGFVQLIGGLARRFGPLAAAIAVFTIATKAWNKEGSNLKKLFEKIKELMAGDFGKLLGKLADIVGNVLVFAFDKLAYVLDKIAALLLFLIEKGEQFANSEFVKKTAKDFGDLGSFATGNATGAQNARFGIGVLKRLNPGAGVGISIAEAAARKFGGAGGGAVSNQATIQQNFYGPADRQQVKNGTQDGLRSAGMTASSGAN